MTSILLRVSLILLCLGVAFLIAAAVIFVKLKIWVVIADLSGKTAQQSIERLRSQSGQAAPRQRHFSYVANSGAIWRGKGTGRLSKKETEPLGRKSEQTLPLNQMGADPDGTMPLDQAELDGTMPLDQAGLDGTMPLDQADPDGTMPLDQAGPDGTMPLDQAELDGTMPLDQAGLDGTMPLDQAGPDGTMPLDQAGPDGTMPLDQETGILDDAAFAAAASDPGATVVMAPEPEPECPIPHGDFVLLEQTVLIHTQEVIPQQSEFHI